MIMVVLVVVLMLGCCCCCRSVAAVGPLVAFESSAVAVAVSETEFSWSTCGGYLLNGVVIGVFVSILYQISN